MRTLIAILLSLFIACSVQAKGLTLVFTEDQYTNPDNIAVPEGLVGYWPFNEGVGSSTADLSGFGATGTITGATWVDGIKGKCLSFDGVDDYVDCGDPANGSLDFGTSSFSFMQWIKPTGLDGVTQVLSGKGPSAYEIHIVPPTNRFLVTMFSGVYQKFIFSTSVAATNTPFFVVGVADQQEYPYGKLKLYINGVLENVSTSLGTQTLQATANFVIGCRSGGTPFYSEGKIDEARIYDRALSSNEVQALYFLKQ